MSVSFSLIVPVYKSEMVLSRCVDSILAQTYTDFELILVDDGSPDASPRICDEYKRKDSRIKVIHKLNGGVSSARNAGMTQARGEYIAFVDSDDYVTLDYLSELVGAFQQSNADIVYMGYNRISSKTEGLLEHRLPDLQGRLVDDLIRLSETDMFGYTWIKAYRRECIGDIHFCENMDLYEDEVFTCAVFKRNAKIAKVDKAIYNYVQNSESLVCRTRQYYYKNCEAVYCAWKEILPLNQEKCMAFLQDKANHFTRICKYYGLEKRVNHVLFFRGLINCDFVKESCLDDRFGQALKKGNMFCVLWLSAEYKAKNMLRRLLKNG